MKSYDAINERERERERVEAPSKKRRAKNWKLSFLAIFFVVGIFSFAQNASAATRTISNSGGTRNWNDTASWVEGVVPVDGDDVVATVSSGNVTVNVSTAKLHSIDLTGYTGTLSVSASQAIFVQPTSGIVAAKFAGAVTWTGAAYLELDPSAGATVNFTSGGLTFKNIYINNGAFSGTTTQQDDLTLSGEFHDYAGRWITNNHNITLSGASAIWDVQTTTFTAGTNTVTFTGTNPAIGTASGKDSNFYNLTLTGAASNAASIYFGRDETVTHTLIINGANNTTNRLLIQSTVPGTQRTLTVTGATFSNITNVDFRDVDLHDGAGQIDLSGITGLSGDCGNNNTTDMKFTSATTQHWITAAGGSWGTVGNWTSRVPLCQDTVVMDQAFNASVTVTENMARLGASVDWSGATVNTALTLNITASAGATVFGSYTSKTGMTNSGTTGFNMAGSGASTLTNHGVSWAGNPVTFNMGSSTSSHSVAIQDALTTTGILTLTSGTLTNPNNSTITVANFVANIQDVTFSTYLKRTLTMCSTTCTWNITGTGSSAWVAVSTLMTLTSGSSTISMTGTGATKTFAGGGLTYNNLTAAGDANATTISGSNTFTGTMTFSSAPMLVKFTNGTTQTVGNFVANGTNGNLITLTSVTTATYALTKTGGGIISSDYLDILHSVASPANTWYAGTHSVPADQNVTTAGSGWTFTAPPTYSIGGTTSGLSGTVQLQDNGGDTLSVSSGSFTFATQLQSGVGYAVTVLAQPGGQTCTVSNDTGTVASANVTNVLVTCVNTTPTGVLTEITPVPALSSSTAPVYTFNSTLAGTIAYGGDCSSATSLAVSGNNTITFNTLAAGTHSNCTIVVSTSSVPSNTLSVSSFTIDTTPPTISSATTTSASGTYGPGTAISIGVNFSEAVTSTGNVTVTLNTAPSRNCTFSISNATSSSCTYTVQSGDSSLILDATISGTVKDQAGNLLSNFTPASTLASSKTINIIATGTVYYLSSSGGNDSNNGLSPLTPWQNVGKVSSKSPPFNPGDEILLKAGDSFDGPLNMSSSGATSSPIIISRYSVGANPIIYGDHPSATSWSAVGGHPGVYSQAFYCGTVTQVYDTSGVYYAQVNRGADTINNWLNTFAQSNWGCDINTIYIRTSDDNAPPVMHLFEWATVYTNKNHVTIQNLDVRNGYMGIIFGGYGDIIQNNSIQDTDNSGIFLNTAWSGEVANNTITRTGETAIYASAGGNHWIHNNTISYTIGTVLGFPIQHAPTPERAGVGLQQGQNNLVEHNSLSYIASSGSFFDYWLESGTIVRYNYGFHSGGAAYPDGTGLRTYGNIFDLDGAGAGIGAGHDYDPVLSPTADTGANVTYNNIIYNFKNYGIYYGQNYGGVIYRNNIIVATTSNMVQVNTGVNSDYNCYYDTGATKRWYWNNTIYTSLAAFQATSSQESHSIYADPQFASTTPVVATDFILNPSSPCINAGQDLKNAGLISQDYTDYASVSVPQGSATDIGPYEYVGNSVPAVPTSIVATAGNHQAIVAFTAGSNGGSPILYYLASSTPGNIVSTAMSSPITVTGLTNGTTYTFQVYAVNAVGTSSPSSASASIILDGTAPTTVAHLPGGKYGTTQSVTLACTDNVGGVGCDKTYYSVDGSAPTIQYTGAINISSNTTLKFYSTDLNSNTESPNTEVYVIDATYPFTTITPNSVSATTSTSISFSFVANKAGSTYECKLDSASFSSCNSPQSLTGLADGSHTFTVRATDTLGHIEPSPAFVTWLVDTTPPDAFTLSSPADNSTTDSTQPNLIWNASVDSGSGLSKYQLYIDGSLDTDNIVANTTASLPQAALSRTAHAWYVEALDVLGNTTTSNTFHFTINPLPTLPTLSVPTASSLSQTGVTLNGSITNDGNALSTVEGFNYGTSQSYGSTASANGTFGIGSFNQTISSLTCGTAYHFQSFATNSSGTQTSSDQTFTTSACTVTPTPTPVVSGGSSSGGGGSAQSQVNNLLAKGQYALAQQIAKQYGIVISQQNIPTSVVPKSSQTFTRTLKLGMTGADVKQLQAFLNVQGFIVANKGAGSSGHETTYFGPATKAALMKFQLAHKKEILDPQNLKSPTGIFATGSMKVANALLK